MTRLVAIHQPNFFPWLGYFDKIARSDIFVFLDDVQFPKTGGSWSNRVRIIVGGADSWASAAIDRDYHGTRDINQMNFLTTHPWRLKIFRSLESSYRKHPHYKSTMDVVEPLLKNAEANVAAYNIHAVTVLAQHLGLDATKMRRSSDLRGTGRSNELLCSLTHAVGGAAYMCGGGADGYQDESVFKESGIQLVRQEFVHPVYSQAGVNEFVPGLSIVDALMNHGASAVGAWIERRR
ncbi:MAG: WbqC family protein [Polaromonas sp.]|uniref:WbqC family protein n=1 Tax=Polaromonas sp. TaxID=1869339 RepID=UPI0017935100|nr:WbqC family protein [Polaromonas sp.]MBA3593214.1 WbqC family protein [Polaromonas sp.]